MKRTSFTTPITCIGSLPPSRRVCPIAAAGLAKPRAFTPDSLSMTLTRFGGGARGSIPLRSSTGRRAAKARPATKPTP